MKILRSMALLLGWLLLSGAAEMPEVEVAPDDTLAAAAEDVDLYEFDIPRVAERQQEEENPPRFPVDGVVIRGVVPYPADGITQESVQAVVDDAFEVEQGLVYDDNGFTERDMLDVGRFLREILDRGDLPDEEDLGTLIDMLDRFELELGWLTVPQLETIAGKVTEFYRSKGFILATAFVPAQEVTDGIVYINVLEGRLGGVTVTGNSVFAQNTIRAPFSPEIGQPVTEDRIEGAIRRINDLPGVRVRGSFSPGQNVGETSLNIGVEEEKSWESRVRVDNHGSETTGARRVYSTAQWHNLGGKGHRLLLGSLQSEGPDSSTFGLIEYEMPVTNDGRGRLTANVTSNEFAVAGFEDLPSDIVGETVNYSIAGEYKFIRRRELQLAARAAYTQKDALFSVEGIATLSTDQVIDVFSFSTAVTKIWDAQQLLFQGEMGLEQGHVISGEVRGQSTNFTKITLNSILFKRFSFENWLSKNTTPLNLLLKVNAQYSEKFLSSVEQFSLGGPNAVRGFSVSDVSVDSGAAVGLDVNFPPVDLVSALKLPIDLEPAIPYVFFDYGYGVARASGTGGGSDRDVEVKGYGVGVKLNWKNKITANFVFARPRSAKFQNNFGDVKGNSQFFFDVTYQIR